MPAHACVLWDHCGKAALTSHFLCVLLPEPASQRALFGESKTPAWRKQLVIAFTEQQECGLKERATCRRREFSPETALPDSSCYLLRDTYCRPRSLLSSLQ